MNKNQTCPANHLKTNQKMVGLKIIFEYLKNTYPDPKTELHYSTDFQLMVAVILSAQSTDRQVNKVTEKLFKKIKKPNDVIKMWFEKFRNWIKSIWLFNNKAKNIWKLSQILSEKFKIPKTVEWLKKLPGIWEKSAKVIAHVLFDKLVIAVDTHVHRVVNRLWIVKTKNPEQTSKLLEKIVPNKYKVWAHHSLVLFGRYICIARKPKCEMCGLNKICKYYKKITKAAKLQGLQS